MIQRQANYLPAGRGAARPAPRLLGGELRPALEIELLGFPQVRRGGEPLVFARRAAMALLAYLAVTRRPHSRERLAALLGGEVADSRARMRLRNALNGLTSQIGEYLVATRQSICLNPELPLALDVAALEDGLRAAMASGEIGWLQQAVERCQHEFLEGFALRNAPAFDEWLLLERERVGQLLVRALDLLCTAYVERGQYIAGLACARRLLALEPWREETHRQVMIMLALSGQRGAMLAQYEACRRILADDLGVEPMAETTALYERLRAAVSSPRGGPSS